MGKKKVDWIKLSTGLFDDDDRIKRIEKRADRDSIMLIWIKLNIQAGRCNAGGTLAFTDVAPLDIEGLSEIFDRPEEEVKKAIDLFLSWGMLEQSEDGFFSLPDWEEDQNEEALTTIRQKTNDRVKRHREKKKLEQQQRATKVSSKPEPPAAPARTKAEKVLPPYDEIMSHYNQIMKKNRKATDPVKKDINARFAEGYSLENFIEVMDKKFAEWFGTDQEKYIDPATLFCKKHFDKYLNQPWPKGKGKKPHETNEPNRSDSRNWAIVE